MKEKGEVGKGEAPSGKKADGQLSSLSFEELLRNRQLLEKLVILAKRERGRLRVGADGVFAVTLSLSDDDFAKLVSGQTQAQRLFMSGKLKIKGDVMKVGPTRKPTLKTSRLTVRFSRLRRWSLCSKRRKQRRSCEIWLVCGFIMDMEFF